MDLVRIEAPEYDVDFALAYATSDNFTGAPVYARPDCWLHREAAARLERSIALAARQNLKLRLFDAFRPTEAQWALWNHTPDPVFLADPRQGSTHSRGIAIDLTLADRQGRPLDMGTRFDAFTPASHHGGPNVSPEVERNRFILLGLMITAGWDFYGKEWWHYQLPDPQRYPLLSDGCLPRSMMSLG